MGLLNKILFTVRGEHKIYFHQGHQRLQQRDFEGAIEAFNQAIACKPHYEAYHNRATAHYKLQNYPEAIRDYHEATNLDPNTPEAYLGLGIVYTKMGQYPEAIESYTQAIRLNPCHTMAYTNRGFARMKLHQFEEAIADFDEAIRANPYNAAAYNNRGAIYFELGEEAKANQDWQKAKELGLARSEVMQDF